MKTNYKIEKMLPLADEIVKFLDPYSEKIQIAGSIQREKPEVSDIEIVLIPNMEQTFDMFGNSTDKNIDLTKIIMKNPHFAYRYNKKGQKMCGDRVKLLLYKGFPVDIFVANENSWATTLLVRTGSKVFNQFIIYQLSKFKYKLDVSSGGIFREGKSPNLVFPKTENEIFEMIGMKYIEPKNRKMAIYDIKYFDIFVNRNLLETN